MIPARKNCPHSWRKEYSGYLMAERSHKTHSSTEFVCVDEYSTIVSGRKTTSYGALFWPVESKCSRGQLPCDSYKEGAELMCVVCTK